MAGLLLSGRPACPAEIYLETFATDDAGWLDRDGAEMLVGHADSYGNPAGSLGGVFDSQVELAPEIDAFRANSGSSDARFTGNYWAIEDGFTSFRFDFSYNAVVPSELRVRFQGLGYTYFSAVTPAIGGTTGTWYSVVVPLEAGYWTGSAANFSNALTSVQWVDVQVTRNGTGAQTFYLDNFALSDIPIVSVPEPDSMLMIVIGAWLVLVMRNDRRTRRSMFSAVPKRIR